VDLGTLATIVLCNNTRLGTTRGWLPSELKVEELMKETSLRRANVGDVQRLIAGATAAVLITAGLTQRRGARYAAMLAGAGLLYCAWSSTRKLWEARRHPRISVPDNRGINVEKTIVIDRAVDEVYRTWRNFENLPHFMNHLEEVRVLDEKRSHWTAKAPAGMNVQWDAEIINEHPNEMIAWRSLEGADVDNAGSVRFRSVPGGTEIRVALEYNPPAGAVGAAFARLFHEEPGQQLEEDLLRFKHLVETAG
jgi:uncharacterized membrane protein